MRLLLLPCAFAFFLTILFLAMRGVMDLGGMVAVGGPYEIAHPAPGYWWIFTISIMACVVIALANMGVFSLPRAAAAANYGPFGGIRSLTEGNGEVSLVAVFFWPAIFLSLGWNFCEYGFFRAEGLAWGWVASGIVFVFMGGIPLYVLLKEVSARELLEVGRRNLGAIWPQLLGIAAAIPWDSSSSAPFPEAAPSVSCSARCEHRASSSLREEGVGEGELLIRDALELRHLARDKRKPFGHVGLAPVWVR